MSLGHDRTHYGGAHRTRRARAPGPGGFSRGKITFRDVRKFGKVEVDRKRFLEPTSGQTGARCPDDSPCGLSRGARRTQGADQGIAPQSGSARWRWQHLRGRGALQREDSAHASQLFALTRRVEAPAGHRPAPVAESHRQRGGSTISDYLKPSGELGGFQDFHRVYGKAGEECSRCGTAIACGSSQAGRSTHHCLKLPALIRRRTGKKQRQMVPARPWSPPTGTSKELHRPRSPTFRRPASSGWELAARLASSSKKLAAWSLPDAPPRRRHQCPESPPRQRTWHPVAFGRRALGHLRLRRQRADEVSSGFDLISVAALLATREKIVNHHSRLNVIVVDEETQRAAGEKRPVPLEVLPFGLASTVRALADWGVPTPRQKGGSPIVTDSGNRVIDLVVGVIADLPQLDRALRSVPGGRRDRPSLRPGRHRPGGRLQRSPHPVAANLKIASGDGGSAAVPLTSSPPAADDCSEAHLRR